MEIRFQSENKLNTDLKVRCHKPVSLTPLYSVQNNVMKRTTRLTTVAFLFALITLANPTHEYLFHSIQRTPAWETSHVQNIQYPLVLLYQIERKRKQ